MNIHSRYHLRQVINACGKMTKLSGAVVLPEIADTVRESLDHFFDLDELQAAAGAMISRASGSEHGCITACTSAGITLSVAATMTGNDLARVWQLPDTEGMKHRVLIQKGHCVNYGAPITQSIRLAGATPIEMGTIHNCPPEVIAHELARENVAAIVAVESHHTARHGWVPLAEVVQLAQEAGVPVIVVFQVTRPGLRRTDLSPPSLNSMTSCLLPIPETDLNEPTTELSKSSRKR